MEEVFDEILNANKGSRVVIVSHATAIMIMLLTTVTSSIMYMQDITIDYVFLLKIIIGGII